MVPLFKIQLVNYLKKQHAANLDEVNKKMLKVMTKSIRSMP